MKRDYVLDRGKYKQNTDIINSRKEYHIIIKAYYNKK